MSKLGGQFVENFGFKRKGRLDCAIVERDMI